MLAAAGELARPACEGFGVESGFAFGVVRQLFERRLASGRHDRQTLRPGLLARRDLCCPATPRKGGDDTTFAVLHGLYWLTMNFADRGPLLIAVDDAQWADEPSLRWLAYVAPRLEGAAVAVLVSLRPAQAALVGAWLEALLVEAGGVVRPQLLSESAVAAIVRAARDRGQALSCVGRCGGRAAVILSTWPSCCEGPLEGPAVGRARSAELVAGGREGVARRVLAGMRGLDPGALSLAQALAVLGDGCQLRHAAVIAGVEVSEAISLVASLVRLEVLATDDPPRFIHPVVRDAVEGSLASDARDALHRSAARLLDGDAAPPGQVAAHLVAVRPVGDGWVVDRLREAAAEAMRSGAPGAAAGLFRRAISEPPRGEQRVGVLREAARAEASAGREAACVLLEEALRLASDRRERAEIALEVAEAYAALFRWVEAVDVIDRARAELDDADEELAARLEGELVVCAVHDARRAARVAPVVARLSSRSLSASAGEALAVARGMSMLLAGRPDGRGRGPAGGSALTGGAGRRELGHPGRAVVESGDRRALRLGGDGTGSYGRRGPTLRERTRIRCRLQHAGPAQAAPGSAARGGRRRTGCPAGAAGGRFCARAGIRGDGAGRCGRRSRRARRGASADRASAPGRLAGWCWHGLDPAARGRLRLAQGRPAEALMDFKTCARMFSAEVWGTEMRDVGYLHARAGAAQALLRLGERDAADQMAQTELADVRVFAAPRALGVASRVAGLAQGGEPGIELLYESVASLRGSPARLELAYSLSELGAALRRAGRRAAASEPLAEALELAVRCGARRLAGRAREELKATGARPRRQWRTGVEALTPSELRVTSLAAEGRTNREIAHELYVTLKTVEGHLSRAYTKLGIPGRAELPGVFGPEKTRVVTP